MLRVFLFLVSTLFLFPSPALRAAQPIFEDGVDDGKDEPSTLEKIWDAPTVYKNKKSDFLNELRLVGRFHADAFSIESNRDDDFGGLINKFRLGFKARMFHQLGIHVEVDLDPEHMGALYKKLTDAYVSWKFSDALQLNIGKQPVRFTLDGATSSNELLTLGRNNLFNNVWQTTEFFNGVKLLGKKKNWQYSAAYFLAGNKDQELGTFSGSQFAVASIGYDFDSMLHVRKALLRADFMHSERPKNGEARRPYENVASLVFQLEDKNWGLSTDLTYASGREAQGDLWGVVVMPSYKLTKRLQAVVRWTYLKSNASRGIRLEHYDELFARGDEYQELYAGLNYYFYGHRLKLQSGLSYADLSASAKDGGHYREWNWTTGLRVSW